MENNPALSETERKAQSDGLAVRQDKTKLRGGVCLLPGVLMKTLLEAITRCTCGIVKNDETGAGVLFCSAHQCLAHWLVGGKLWCPHHEQGRCIVCLFQLSINPNSEKQTHSPSPHGLLFSWLIYLVLGFKGTFT